MKKTFIFLILLASISIYIAYRRLLSPAKLSPYTLYAHLIPGTYRVGFTNLDKEVVLDNLPVKGTIPSWLSGTLFRNGPAKFTENASFVSNWFDGLAMLHRFSFHDGKVAYANKFLKSDNYETVKKTGKMSYGGFAQDPCRSLFKHFFSLFIPTSQHILSMPNANVSIARYTNNFIALTETPLPIRFDPQTLDTLGVLDYNDTFAKARIHESAHPHYDSHRKEHISYLTEFGRISTYMLYRIKDGTTQRQPIAKIEVDRPSYMHSFALTKNYAILTAIPLVVNPLDLLLKQQAFIKNFKWQPERGTQFIVIDRINDTVVGSFKGPAFFTFHHVNAFEQDSSIIIDLIAYPDGREIGQASLIKVLASKQKHEQKQTPVAEPDVEVVEGDTLTRYILNLNTKEINSEILSNERIELPQINYDSYNGKNYTYVYAAGKNNSKLSYVFDMLAKINVKTKEVRKWHQNKCYPGEPVFVPSPQAHKEDDGVILSVVLDASRETSFLLILDAETFTELGRAELPHHIPFGLHGIYINKHLQYTPVSLN